MSIFDVKERVAEFGEALRCRTKPIRLLPVIMIVVAGISALLDLVGAASLGGDWQGALFGLGVADSALLDWDGVTGRVLWFVVGAGALFGTISLLDAIF